GRLSSGSARLTPLHVDDLVPSAPPRAGRPPVLLHRRGGARDAAGPGRRDPRRGGDARGGAPPGRPRAGDGLRRLGGGAASPSRPAARGRLPGERRRAAPVGAGAAARLTLTLLVKMRV